MLHLLLFVVLPYLCLVSFVIGVFYRYFAICKHKQYSNNYNKVLECKKQSGVLISGVIGIIAIHIAGYLVVKLVFVATNLSYDSIKTSAKFIQAIAMLAFLTGFTFIICYKKIKQQANIFGNAYNNIITAIIVLHIAVGYLGIMLVGKDFNKVEKKLLITNYFKDFFSFNLASYTHLINVHYITNVHLILGFLFLAIIPYSSIFDRTYTVIFKLFNKAR